MSGATPSRPIDRVRQDVFDWIRANTHGRFQQVWTVDGDGFPVGRTTYFPLNDDWSIDCNQWRYYARADHVRRNPRMEALWIDSTLRVPKAVFIRSLGYVVSDEDLIRIYETREDAARARGGGYGTRMYGDTIPTMMTCIHMQPVRVRAEGFGQGTEVFTWEERGEPGPAPEVEPLRPKPPAPKVEPSRSIDEVVAEGFAFCREYRGFQQLVTISRDGFPTGRSTWVPLNDDWTIDSVQDRTFARVQQVARDPHVEVLWIDTAPRVPRAVFVRGLGRLLPPDEVLAIYTERRDRAEQEGRAFGKRLDPGFVREQLTCIHIEPVKVRFEGFGKGAEAFTWTVPRR